MRSTLSIGLAALTALALAAPAAGELSDDPTLSGIELDSKAQQKLDRLLEGRVRGEPVVCINYRSIRTQTKLSDDLIAYQTPGVVYLNRPKGGCPGAKRNALISQHPNASICAGEVILVQDPFTGAPQGSCAFSEFVPYRRAEKSGD